MAGTKSNNSTYVDRWNSAIHNCSNDERHGWRVRGRHEEHNRHIINGIRLKKDSLLSNNNSTDESQISRTYQRRRIESVRIVNKWINEASANKPSRNKRAYNYLGTVITLHALGFDISKTICDQRPKTVSRMPRSK